jgi:hypothetical protein
MQRRVLIALLTVFVFGAGYLARVWTERQLPLPPPLTPGGEFASSQTPAPGPMPPVDRAKLSAEIEQLKPQIDEFRKRLRAIDAEFDHNLQAILTPDQLSRYLDRKRRRANDPRQLHSADPRPLTDAQIMMLHEQPLYAALDHISLELTLDDLNNDLKFDDAQRAKIHDLLLKRREEFIMLVDDTPPPSLILSRLASVAQRLAAGSGAAPDAPKP